MVKKLKAMAAKKSAAGAGLFDRALASSVRESAQQIWLAGMGAFAKAQAEGKQRFEALVNEGMNLQKKTHAVAEERINEVTTKMTSMADDAAARAGKQWDKLESIFEERTARAMKSLGVPSAKDDEELKARIEELAAQIARSARPAARKTGAKSTAARKTAAKRARKSAA